MTDNLYKINLFYIKGDLEVKREGPMTVIRENVSGKRYFPVSPYLVSPGNNL
jgi:hypothetical protein